MHSLSFLQANHFQGHGFGTASHTALPLSHYRTDAFPTTQDDGVGERSQLHHGLSFTERMAYTNGARNRLKNAPFTFTDDNLKRDFHFALGMAEMYNGELDFKPEDYTTNTRTALKRLGADPDEILERYLVCPKCWNLVEYGELYTLTTPECQAMVAGNRRRRAYQCATPLYELKGKIRAPFSVLPITKSSRALRLLLQDQNLTSKLQLWRGINGDSIETPEQQTHQEVEDRDMLSMDPDSVMTGITDGAAWPSHAPFVKRVVLLGGKVEEVVTGPAIMRHDALKFGVKVVMNLDW